uniref:Uncharacterized protein n=1 Tax=Anguilla anguilla TaxID=7936 RepID=A0A0E9QCS4_ANGAN
MYATVLKTLASPHMAFKHQAGGFMVQIIDWLTIILFNSHGIANEHRFTD